MGRFDFPAGRFKGALCSGELDLDLDLFNVVMAHQNFGNLLWPFHDNSFRKIFCSQCYQIFRLTIVFQLTIYIIVHIAYFRGKILISIPNFAMKGGHCDLLWHKMLLSRCFSF